MSKRKQTDAALSEKRRAASKKRLDLIRSLRPEAGPAYTLGDGIDDKNETWYALGPEFPEASVSSFGRIDSGHGRALYNRTVKLYRADGSVTKQVLSKSIIASHFLGPAPEGYAVKAKNGDKGDRRPTNLVYVQTREICDAAAITFTPGKDSIPEDLPETWARLDSIRSGLSVSTLGRAKIGRNVVPEQNVLGYRIASLVINGAVTQQKLHRLVMLAFHGPCPVGMEVAHLDDDRTNNRLSNLEYQTRSENCTQAQKKHKKSLTAVSDSGKILPFQSASDAAKFFGLAKGSIYVKCGGKHRTFTNGEYWSFSYDKEARPRLQAPDRIDWTTVPEFPEYECSGVDGAIRRRGSKFMLRTPLLNGYPSVVLRPNGRGKTYLVHTIACSTFHGKRPTKDHFVHHVNRNILDNSSANLSWRLRSEGTGAETPCERLLEDGMWEKFPSINQAIRDTGITGIHHAITGLYKTSGGYIWRLAESAPV